MSEEQSISVSGGIAPRKVYLKDLSFESPGTPEVFAEDEGPRERPRFEIDLELADTEMPGGESEIVVRLQLHLKVGDGQTLFLIEVAQAGIFNLSGISGEDLVRMKKVECPRLLFPFLREAVWTLVGRGGMPTPLIRELDFDALYAQI